MEYTALEGIGLTNSEIIVYTTLLKVGRSTTGKIVKKSKVSSGKIYEILDKLIEKGLCSYIFKNNVKYFCAAEPYKIKEYVHLQKLRIDQKQKEIAVLIPQLITLKKFQEEEYSTEIFDGLSGFHTAILSAIEDTANNSEFLSMGGSGKRRESELNVWNRVSTISHRKKLTSRFIVTDKSQKSRKLIEEYVKKFHFLNVRYLSGFHLAPICMTNDRVIIINFKRLSAVVIKSVTITRQFRFFFESLWKIAKND